MAVTQEQYFDAIGRAGLVFSDGVLENITLEKAGCTPCWNDLFCQLKQIECAEYFYRLGDYAVSDDSATFYRYMECIAGSQYSDATVDPNAQLLGTVIIIEGGSGRALKVVMDPSSTNLSKTYLNATYPYDLYQEGDIVYVPDAFLQYTKLENTVNSDWNESPLNYVA